MFPRHNVSKVSHTIILRSIVAIEALGYQGDLYSEILSEYQVLQPINVRVEQQIRASVQES
ncbi:Protein of unknown function [Bacillus cereus]|uniref:hypothetical protein n=1 Tax=Bacillus wiedmannii TaxID=1890302 RepID=UPI000818365D|nr:hypothetical protein [Bacillus wiedmannii]SCC64809.1 Protein of unknown function [Bacillus cereus]SCN39760.1 Protein of unknown function [Bacillus wiedmannii]HDR7666617.1 hypothetical protein [Bacillus wiedmannii]